MRLKWMCISSGWGTAKNCLPCSCFHLCCKLCLRLMQSRKQLPSILGYHPKTLVLLGTEPYTIFLTATRYHQLSSTSHAFPEAWDLLITQAAYWGKHFVQNDAKREWLILLRWRWSTGRPAWQVEVASYLRKHPPGLLLCPARSNLPRSHLHTTIFLSMKTRTLLKAQQIQTKTPHFCVCWDYFPCPPYHTSPQSLATASDTSDSILLLFTPVHATVGFFPPLIQPPLAVPLPPEPFHHVLWGIYGGSRSYLPNTPSSTPSPLPYPQGKAWAQGGP